MAVVPRECLDERGDITTPRKREGGQIQASGPPLGALAQDLDFRLGQIQSEDVVKETAGLNGLETEIISSQL